MKKYIFVATLLFFFALSLCAQDSIKVVGFEMDPHDQTANLSSTMKRDQNGEVCALIRVQTPEKGFLFDVGVLGIVDVDEDHTGEIWVYVPYGVKRFSIRHAKYSPLINFYLPEVIKKARTYIMKLDIKKRDDGKAMQKLVVKFTPTTAILLVDGQPVQGNMGYAEVELPVGKHEYMVVNNGYFSQNGTVEIIRQAPAKLNIELTPQVASNETPSNTPPQNNNSQTVVTPPTPQPYVATPPVNPNAKKFVANGVEFYMIPVEGGTFTMGATPEQEKPYSDEKPAHQVTLSSYYIGETEVTQALWTAVMGNNPSRFTDPTKPVEQVSWNDCQNFIIKLNSLTGQKFRLPTEAEWEYAARGGNKSMGYQYSGSNNLDDVAWYDKNSFNTTQSVKTKRPNELGIYDMSGNVWEWCQDRYDKKYYKKSPKENPMGPNTGSLRVLRGGGWNCSANDSRSASRSLHINASGLAAMALRMIFTPDYRHFNLGLRLVLSE
ncbi:MAG: formylglycine-generating enzyme family protein [Prevotellaceae bacterium]|nr:formylglycine-generating enzyme family protein [Prevotellaceae bacterium]